MAQARNASRQLEQRLQDALSGGKVRRNNKWIVYVVCMHFKNVFLTCYVCVWLVFVRVLGF